MSLVCVTCGAQYPTSAATEPDRCIICKDERQYVGLAGQEWVDRGELQKSHKNVLRDEEPNMLGIGTEPSFAIGQRALLIQTGAGNVLWDCINVLTPDTIEEVQSKGGVQAIAISHPHFYTGMAAWAEAFDAPVFIHAKDRQWVTEPCSRITFWEGDEKQLFGGARLLRLGGHFPGSAVLHWSAGAGGKGVLCTGDTIQGILDKRWVSFMYSYPNLIPLPSEQVARIGKTVKEWPYSFEHLYAGWFGKGVEEDAQQAVIRSADRYVGILDGTLRKNYW